MKFTSKNTNYNSPKGKGWFINPYVRPNQIVKNPLQKRYSVQFDLCVLENGIERILDSHTLQFTEFDIKAQIEVNGVQVDLIQHLLNGGSYDPAAVTVWGVPDYDELTEYFEEGFTPLEFKEGQFKFLAIDWCMNVIKVEGMLLKESFELEVI